MWCGRHNVTLLILLKNGFCIWQHMKNYKDLLKKISRWMKQDGLLFVHHFCHKAFAYHFEVKPEEDFILLSGTSSTLSAQLFFLPVFWCRTKMKMTGLLGISSVGAQCLQQIYCFISRWSPHITFPLSNFEFDHLLANSLTTWGLIIL